MKEKICYLCFLSMVFLGTFLASAPSYSQACKIDKVEREDFTIKDSKQVDEILKLIQSQSPDAFDYSANVEILKADINNDGREEYVVYSWEGTGSYLNWNVYSLDGHSVPDKFWGMDNRAKADFLNAAGGPSTEIWIATQCGKNYFGYRSQDGAQQLYLIDTQISKHVRQRGLTTINSTYRTGMVVIL